MNLSRRENLLYGALSLVMGGDVRARAAEVRGRIGWDPESFERFRLERCRRLLLHAAAKAPYYRDVFARIKFDPPSFQSFDQLSQLPALTRDVLRDSFESLRDPGATEFMRKSTGGTTGIPVTVLLDTDKQQRIETLLITHRMYALAGRHLGDPTLMIAGSPIDYQAWTSYRDKLKNRLFNVKIRSSFKLDGTTLAAIIGDLRSGEYPTVIAYASVFDIICSFLEDRGESLHIKRIIPCAELVSAGQRERWRTTLGAEVFEIYGSREMVSIAGETADHCGLMINADLYHVEITDESGTGLPDGTPGLITVTQLLNRSLPLIRYQLGDVGMICAQRGSGAFSRYLKITHGRVLDIIRTPGGKMLPGEFFPHLMKERSHEVYRFQVVQTDLSHLVVNIVRTERYSEATGEFLRAKIAEQVGPEMQIELRFVNEIETSASGKYRPTISLINPEKSLFVSSQH